MVFHGSPRGGRRPRATARAAFHGVEGYSRKGDRPTSASHYYSFTRLTTSGTVTIGGEELPVQGQSWMDREFGSNQLGPDQQGWDWFSFSLDDGRDVMLYRVRDRADTSSFESGTMIDSEGRARPLAAGGWTATATSEWLSPATGTRYPGRLGRRGPKRFTVIAGRARASAPGESERPATRSLLLGGRGRGIRRRYRFKGRTGIRRADGLR